LPTTCGGGRCQRIGNKVESENTGGKTVGATPFAGIIWAQFDVQSSTGRWVMKLDVPEILIVLGVLAGIAWAIYNRLHPHVEPPARRRPAGRLPSRGA
jgi:hypothetical protein